MAAIYGEKQELMRLYCCLIRQPARVQGQLVDGWGKPCRYREEAKGGRGDPGSAAGPSSLDRLACARGDGRD